MTLVSERRTDLPKAGEFPYTAGIHATGYAGRLWTMRQLAGLGDAKRTNERFRYLLSLGETGLSLAFDLPTQMGLDPDDPRAAGEVGRVGVSITTVDDLARVFDGISLDAVSVALTINATAPILLAMWIVVAEEQGVSPTLLRGTIQNEMLKEFLARHAVVFDLERSFRYSVDVIEYAVRALPHVNPISISGGHAREAGASRELEVACAIADAETYLAAALKRGMSVDELASAFSFIFGTGVEVLEEAAKLRAARRLYATRMRDRWGARAERALKMRIQVNTFGSYLTWQEPLNNVSRATLQALAAILGGAQSLHVCAFDEAHRTPTPLAARVALRTQQILAEEAGLVGHVDPLGGSKVIEDMTDKIEAGAQGWLQRIAEKGGMLAALASGWLEGEIEEMAYQSRENRVGGANWESDPGEEALLAVGPDDVSRSTDVDSHALRPDCTSELRAVRDASRSGRNVLPSLIDAARRRATLAQMTAALA